MKEVNDGYDGLNVEAFEWCSGSTVTEPYQEHRLERFSEFSYEDKKFLFCFGMFLIAGGLIITLVNAFL